MNNIDVGLFITWNPLESSEARKREREGEVSSSDPRSEMIRNLC